MYVPFCLVKKQGGFVYRINMDKCKLGGTKSARIAVTSQLCSSATHACPLSIPQVLPAAAIATDITHERETTAVSRGWHSGRLTAAHQPLRFPSCHA